MQQEKLVELLQAANKQEQQRQAEAAIETQIKILSATFDKSVAYTNLIVLAAYAGFFGLWQLTKEFVTKEVAFLSALLMLVSVAAFVAFEVVKMVYINHNMMEKAKALKLPAVRQTPHALARALQEIGEVNERVGVHLMRYWAVTLIVTIASGMAAASVLGYAFVSGLAR